MVGVVAVDPTSDDVGRPHKEHGKGQDDRQVHIRATMREGSAKLSFRHTVAAANDLGQRHHGLIRFCRFRRRLVKAELALGGSRMGDWGHTRFKPGARMGP